MCRYAMSGPYKQHHACFACRKMFRRPAAGELARPPAAGEAPPAPCPDCGRSMSAMGLDFKAPKRRDAEQWGKVRLLFARGYAFHSCGCSGPGPRPARLRDVEGFVAEQERLRRERERGARLAAEETARRVRRTKTRRWRDARVVARPARAAG